MHVLAGLNQFKGVGEEEAKELTNKVDQLMNNMPNYAGMSREPACGRIEEKRDQDSK